MIIIARNPMENLQVKRLADALEAMHIPVEYVDYENSFGYSLWSVQDLDELEETQNWSLKKRILFLESINKQLAECEIENTWSRLQFWASAFQKEHPDMV